jgi:SAM-dependent methyltransferase
VTSGRHQAEPERWSRLFAWMYGLTGRNSRSNRVVVELAALVPEDRALDLGCGPGAALAAAAKLLDQPHLAGVDPTPGFVDQCRRRLPGADIRLGSAEEIPFEDGRFTVAWTIATFHHWVDPDAGLAELSRVLAPGGRLLLVEGIVRKSGGHGVGPGEAEQLRSRVDRAGFVATSIEPLKVGWHRYAVVRGSRPEP